MKNFVMAAVLLTGVLNAQEAAETLIPEVTVASKTKTPLFRTGKPVTLLTSNDLEKFSGQSVPEIIAQVAGIQIAGNFNNPQEPKTVKIRGGKNANVLLLIDGVPLKDVSGNDYNLADLRVLSPEMIESIEILNGASSVLYGSNAGVSVINIHTKKSRRAGMHGEIGLKAGSFKTFGQNAGVRGRIEKLTYSVAAANEKSEGLSSAEGKDFDTDGFGKQNMYASMGFRDDYLTAQVDGSFQKHDYDYDTGAFADGNQRGADQQYYAGGNLHYKYNNGNLHFNSRWSQNFRTGKDLVNEAYQDQFSYSGTHLFTEVYNSYSFSHYVSLVSGVQYEAQKLGSKNLPWGGTELEEVYTAEDTKNSNVDFFGNLTLTLFQWNMDMGARYTHHSKFGGHTVYSINPYYIKSIAEYYLKFGYSFATAFIAPTLYQSYGFLPYILPNEGLKPETNASHDVHFSAGRKDESIILKTSFFIRNEKNGFAYTPSDGDPYVGIFRNIAENTVKGFEVETRYRVHEKLRLGSNFSFVEKKNPESMLRQPRQKWNNHVELTVFPSNRITVSHHYVSSRSDAFYDSADFSVKNVELPPYHLFNLNISQGFGKNFRTHLNIGNLFNTPYTDITGFTSRPRNFMAGAQYQF